MTAVQFQNVSKTFSRRAERLLLRSYLQQFFGVGPKTLPFYALKNVSFSVEQGESVAFVGPNGAGKSTLLSVITGLCPADEGEVAVNGRVAALLELGSGFHPDLTGAENVRTNSALLGLNHRQTEAAFARIVEFSEIGDFIDEPLRTYSAGMMMRLAFSVAVNVDPNILIVDEVLAVGDQAFQGKCIQKVFEFKTAGKTILCASHSPALVESLCERAIWLNHGQVLMDGPVSEVLEAYGHGAPPVPPPLCANSFTHAG